MAVIEFHSPQLLVLPSLSVPGGQKQAVLSGLTAQKASLQWVAASLGVHEASAAMPSAAVSASSRFLMMFSFRLDAGAPVRETGVPIHTGACGRENEPTAAPPRWVESTAGAVENAARSFALMAG